MGCKIQMGKKGDKNEKCKKDYYIKNSEKGAKCEKVEKGEKSEKQ